jgi:hypothetical protein
MYVDGPELTPFALVKSVDPAGPGAAAVRPLRALPLSLPLRDEALPEIFTESLGLTFQLQGVKADDQILSFGSVASENHDGLKALAGQVRKGERVEVELLRQGSRVRVGLVPRDGWGGRGLIGYVLLRAFLVSPVAKLTK